ncbi:MAG: hormogonium polysaccharide biosynthesis glycosyltransferase HpsE, partial [Cyanobacteria bacterium P01_F01_bin.153]
NGAQRVPQVLERLLAQQHLEHIRWEVLVIDNNSTDKTPQVVHDFQEKWRTKYGNSKVPLRYLKEIRQGAAHARQKAVEMAQGQWVAFLDDDNIPTANWIFEVHQFADFSAQSQRKLGAFGGKIHGVFPEGNQIELIRYVRPFLAIVERGDRPFQYELEYKVLPPSAGLVVRREAWLKAVPKTLILGGRTADSMLTSEDLETLVHLQRKEWEVWYNPAMEIDHLIPQWRLERQYLIPFLRGIGLTRYVIRMLRLSPWKRPLWTVIYALNDFRKLTDHFLKFRQKLGRDLVVDCKFTLLYSNLVSPVFMGYQRLKRVQFHLRRKSVKRKSTIPASVMESNPK